MPTPTITRKRSIAHLDQDELSLEKDKTPLSHSKRRKTNPTDGAETIIGAIGKNMSKYLGWSAKGKGKENKVVEEEDEEIAESDDSDELAETPPPAAENKVPTRQIKDAPRENKHKKDIWIPSSPEPEKEQKRTVKKLGSGRSSAVATLQRMETSAKAKITSTKKTEGSMTIDVLGENIEATPEVEESAPIRPGNKVGSASAKSKKVRTSAKEDNPMLYRSPGRPSKAALLKKAKQLARQGRRANLAAGEQESEDEVEDSEAETAPQPKKERKKKASTRGRGRPRKHTENLIEPSNHTPKGILTPSKGRPRGPRKSVVFEPEADLDLGFKDIPTTVSAKKIKEYEETLYEEPEKDESEVAELETPAIVATAVLDSEESGSEDDPDTPCEICSKRNSIWKNPIILCDGCDAGYHVKCYGLAEVPKEDKWFCRNCRPDQEELSFPQLQPPTVEASVNTPDIEGFEEHLRCMQRVVLDKLTGRWRVKLRGYEDEMQKVHQVVEQTVMAGEGNSMLVIGARGCGKTTLVESVISDISDHRENFHVVRLNGFVHTDDKLALKEIWRQLGREMEVEDDHTSSNHADTLATLLALLSHPSEISESNSEQTAKSVIFVLDEFDLFTTHPRQTLLYNLFDIAQAKKAPIVVLGLTTKVDVVESLEKRVKSRFSHRYVHLSLPRNIPAFWEICKEGLLADAEDMGTRSSEAKTPGRDEFVSYWQGMIKDLYSKDATFKHLVQSEFYRTKSVPAFFTSCILPIANLSARNHILAGKSFTSNCSKLSAPDSKLQILQELSELELALLIAAARLDIILDTDTCNFAMAYDEYSSLTSRHKISISSTGIAALGASAKVWGRDVSLGAWEKLAEYELLVPAGIGGGGRDFGASGRMWRVDVGLEEITGSVDGLSTVMTKWCREI